MRVRCLPPAFAVLILIHALQPARADCSPPPDQKITVNIEAPAPARDSTQSIAQLTGRAPPDRRPEMRGYDYALGMTETFLDSTLAGQTITESDGRGHFCSVFQFATVTVAWRTVVHIASDLKPGTCVQRMTLLHEQGHVDIDRSMMPIARADILKAITAVARRAVTAGSFIASGRALQERAATAIERAIHAFSIEEARRQLTHDTPAEYAKLPEACGAETVNRLLERQSP
jgi:hypothetical protein